jgi:hypothetical protein
MNRGLQARSGWPLADAVATVGVEHGRAQKVDSSAHSVSARAPWQITALLVLTVLVPVELGFNIGSLFFTWVKAYLFVMSLVVLPLSLIRLHLRAFDWALIAHALWTFVAYVVGFGLAKGLQAGGDYLLEVVTVYLMVRFYVQDLEQVVGIIRLLFWLVLITTIFAIPEALFGVRFVHEFAQSVTGNFYLIYREDRLGMLRAASSFEHPILFGVFCAALLSPMWFTTHGVYRILKAVVIATGTFFSLSSAPLLILAAQIGLIAVERTTRWLHHRVSIFTSGILGVALYLHFFTGRGIIGVITLLMLDPATAWYRAAQLEYSGDDILRHPLFGLGTDDWTRPVWVSQSIDDHFLAIVIRSGIPALIFFLAALYFLWSALARIDAGTQPILFERLRRGWGLMMVALILGGLTVTYFGRMLPLLSIYLGIGGCVVASADRSTGSPVSRVSEHARGHARVGTVSDCEAGSE